MVKKTSRVHLDDLLTNDVVAAIAGDATARAKLVAAEVYKVCGWSARREIAEAISAKPRRADIITPSLVFLKPTRDVQVTPAMAKAITRYLIKNNSTDNKDKQITAAHHNARVDGTIDLVVARLIPGVREDEAPI